MDPFFYALVAAACGYMWWQHARRAREVPQLATRLDESAEIALHVARHEAQQRGHGVVTTTCLLYGLLQDETITAAITATGGDPDAIEDRVLAALDEGAEDLDASPIVALQLQVASHRSRLLSCVDLWAGLALLHASAPAALSAILPGALPTALINAGGVEAADVLFTLTHGRAEKDVPWPDGPSVSVVLINDHITTQDFVVDLLHRVFDKGDEARSLMLEVHHHGRGVVGRFDADQARSKIAAARQSARSAGFPLWIKAE